MNETNQMQVVGVGSSALELPSQTVSPLTILKAIMDGQIPAANVEKALEICYKMEDRLAEKSFAVAFSALQADIPAIRAVHVVPDKQGNQKFKVAKFEEMMEQLGPILSKHKFTISFLQSYEKDLPLRITVTCVLQHTPSGHKVERPFTARVGNGPPGCSEFQADGAVSSYCKMRSLCQTLNILIERGDEDPRSLGQPITREQAVGLMVRMQKLQFTPTRELKFLAWAGAATEGQPGVEDYQKITSGRFKEIDEWLTKEEAKPK